MFTLLQDGAFTETNRARCLIDIVDEDWAKDKLPDAGTISPQTRMLLIFLLVNLVVTPAYF